MRWGPLTFSLERRARMPTRRIFELIIVTVALWDVAKGTIRIWTRKTWGATQPGSLAHDTADIVSVFL